MEQKTGSITREVLTYEHGQFLTRRRELVDEVSWRIFIDGREAAKLSCSPWGLEEAAVGCLFTEGYIKTASEIREVQLLKESGIIAVETAEADAEKILSGEPLSIMAEEIMSLAAALEDSSQLFHRTGGVHCAALASRHELLVRREDVSRHAAVDKLAGACLQQGIPMEDRILVFSGRVPGEILHKAAAMGCSMVIARSAPTDHACRLAEQEGIVLVGFAREDGFNIYTHPERVIR